MQMKWTRFNLRLHGALGVILAALGLFCAGSRAQSLANSLQYSTQNLLLAGNIPPGYQIGPGDVLYIHVDGMPELDRSAVVGAHGRLHIGYLPKPVAVYGLTVQICGLRVAQALGAAQVAISPQVEVFVLKVRSKPITVGGAVQKPSVIQASRPLTLLEVLLRAGGPLPHAGQFVLVTRRICPVPVTGRSRHCSILARTYPLDRVLAGASAYNPLLRGHDNVQVLPRGRIFVAGDVNQPGAYPINQGERMNVAKAMSLAHSWQTGADPGKAVIVHAMLNGATRVIHVNLPRIMARKAPDLQLQANDILYVPTNNLRTVGFYTVKGLASSAFLGLAYILTKF